MSVIFATLELMKRIGRLEVISFTTGFSLMAYELAAARILAPTIGSSMYVWTSVIGIIIAALSLGYYVGGLLADKRGQSHDISWLLVIAAVFVMITVLIYPGVLGWIVEWEAIDVRIQAVVAALVLFAPASFILGTISPYLAKLNVRSLDSSGQAVASLSAFNSIGGITGTFATGFVLFGYIGSRETIMLVVALLICASWVMEYHHDKYMRLSVTLFMVLAGLALMFNVNTPGSVSIDTASARYEVREFYYGGAPVRGLITGPGGVQSAVYLDGSKDLVFWYTKVMAELTIAEQPKSVLVLGGGAFTLPEYLAIKLPGTKVDMVEIDPELEVISRDYFNFKPKENLSLIFEDARTYVNQSNQEYDVVIVDVYGDSEVPFSLATREYGEAVAALTSEDGVVLVNIIGGLTGPCRDVFDIFNSTYAQGLPNGSYVINPSGNTKRTNIVARYSRRGDTPSGLTAISMQPSKSFDDNFAPLERIYHRCAS